jgi:hypothetical protein
MFRFARHGVRVKAASRLDRVSSSRAIRALPLVLIVAGSPWGCTEEVRLGRVLDDAGVPPPDTSAGTGGQSPGFPIGGGAGGGGAGAGGVAPVIDAGPCVPVTCGGNTPLACGNCQDDDGDGLLDASDPECLGPCDDSELELYSGVESPVTGSCRSDCYFDRNAGSGDDGCSWSYRCDPGSVAPDYPPTGSVMCGYDPSLATCDPSSAQADACRAGCLPLTPNGCDCFGCCELPAGSNRFIWLGSPRIGETRCELATSADSDACRPCTPEPTCQNRCEECELCVGKLELPPSCSGAGGPACAGGGRSCDPRTSAGCGILEYCIAGCCVPLPA